MGGPEPGKLLEEGCVVLRVLHARLEPTPLRVNWRLSLGDA